MSCTVKLSLLFGVSSHAKRLFGGWGGESIKHELRRIRIQTFETTRRKTDASAKVHDLYSGKFIFSTPCTRILKFRAYRWTLVRQRTVISSLNTPNKLRVVEVFLTSSGTLKIPRLLWYTKVNYRIQDSQTPVPTRSQMNQIHTL